METQLNILSESLDKKIKILEEIQKLNEVQEEALKKESADIDAFDEAFGRKDVLIEQLERLDDGFEATYEKLSAQLKANRAQYAGQIKVLQEKIKQVTDLSVAIQAKEARNKALMEDYIRKERQGIRQNRQSSKAAYDYYKSMSGVNYASRSWDAKQ